MLLAVLGDSVTTDHISPAGAIAPAAVRPENTCKSTASFGPIDFNSYGSRRGNDRVMARGTFANIRIRNQCWPKASKGGFTRHLPDGPVKWTDLTTQRCSIRSRACRCWCLAGAEYGTGSSRDWAAKGTQLLGVRAVIASSFERIHRSNLVGMGVLPLELPGGQTWQSLGLSGEETFEITGLDESLTPGAQLTVRATTADGSPTEFTATARIDTPVELDYYRNGGILQTVLRKLAT